MCNHRLDFTTLICTRCDMSRAEIETERDAAHAARAAKKGNPLAGADVYAADRVRLDRNASRRDARQFSGRS